MKTTIKFLPPFLVIKRGDIYSQACVQCSYALFKSSNNSNLDSSFVVVAFTCRTWWCLRLCRACLLLLHIAYCLLLDPPIIYLFLPFKTTNMTAPQSDRSPRIVILQRPTTIAFRRWWWDQTRTKKGFVALFTVLMLLSVVMVLVTMGAAEGSIEYSLKQEQKENAIEEVERDYEDKKKTSSTCDYVCQTQTPQAERLGNNMPLYAGQAMCKNEQRFGLNQNGDLVSHDCETDKQEILWERKKISSPSSISFLMKDDGFFQIYSKSTVIWESKPKRTVYNSSKCLNKPQLDCPYLHLRKTGMVVLNWIDQDTGEWMDRDMKRIYTEIFP